MSDQAQRYAHGIDPLPRWWTIKWKFMPEGREWGPINLWTFGFGDSQESAYRSSTVKNLPPIEQCRIEEAEGEDLAYAQENLRELFGVR